ncbi:MAG: ECF-type sigma factor [Acidobacteriota bacterium]
MRSKVEDEMAEPGVTALLKAWGEGDREAFDALVPLVLEELRRLAKRHLARERADHTLQPTALINEVYVRWASQERFDWRDRASFFAVAGAQIRRILVEHARRRKSAKRGNGVPALRLSRLEEVAGESGGSTIDLIDLDRALIRLAEMEPLYCRIVELRYFAGLSTPEVAEVVGLSERTVLRHWAWIKAWLACRLDQTSEAS